MNPEEVTFRGAEVERVRIVDKLKNIYACDVKGFRIIFRQPRPFHVANVLKAIEGCSEETLRKYSAWNDKDVNEICSRPIFTRKDIGSLFIIMVLDGEVVGTFSFVFAKMGEERVARHALGIVDKWQGKGIGTIASHMRELVAKSLGARWIIALGGTRLEGGMFNTNLRRGWEITGYGKTRASEPKAFMRKKL